MNVEQIVTLLIQERDRIDTAIRALGEGAKRRGRPPKAGGLPQKTEYETLVNQRQAKTREIVRVTKKGPAMETSVEPKKKRHVSAAARRRMAEGQRKRWAAVKAGK